MPTLNWIGKVNHHHQVPFRLLNDVPDLACGEPGAGNRIVEGDNLEALKALLPYYAGQVKCIYIDPPYNTGNEGWVYNDNVRSPIIEEWLGKTVGKEGETLDRHDRWLCMMYPRLALLREFLREDGSIWISLDDNEIKLTRAEAQLQNYQNPDHDSRSPWNSATYTCNKSADERPNLFHGITNPNTGEEIWPKRTAVWKYDQARHRNNEAQGIVWWGKSGNAKMPRLKRFLNEVGDVVPRSFLHYDEAGHTQGARSELLDMMEQCPFTTPKPTRLIERILQIATNPGDLVLDSFAGSGTTGHAVLKMNAVEAASRRLELEGKTQDASSTDASRRLQSGKMPLLLDTTKGNNPCQ